MKTHKSIFLVLFLIYGCNQPSNNVIKEKPNKPEITTPVYKHEISESKVLLNTEGVITINEKVEFKDTFSFNVNNSDSTLWRNVDFSSNMINKYDVSPYAFNYDNYVLVFRCIEVSDSFYRVIINEEKNVEKLIPKQQRNLVFETWEQHIVNRAAAVDFSPKKNPLKSDTSGKAKTIIPHKDAFFHPVKISGDWLLVKDDEGALGWIKWKNNAGEFLIDIFYDM